MKWTRPSSLIAVLSLLFLPARSFGNPVVPFPPRLMYGTGRLKNCTIGSMVCQAVLRASIALVAGSFCHEVSGQLFIISTGRADRARYGFIDREGKVVIKPQFEAVEDFSCGLAPVRVGAKWGYIDEKGRISIKPQFDGCFKFSEGFGRVLISGKQGFVNTLGKFIGEPCMHSFTHAFSGGFAVVSDVAVGKSGCRIQLGFIDTTGKEVIKLEPCVINASGVEVGGPSFCGGFKEGLCVVKQGCKFGFIDRSGKFAIKPAYSIAGDFSSGLAPVRKSGLDHQMFFINRKGEEVFSLKCDACSGFTEGLAYFQVKGLFGYIDTNGREAIPARYDGAWSFRDGTAKVCIVKKPWFKRAYDVYGFIGKDGTYLIEPQFEMADEFSSGLAKVWCDGGWEYIDKTGRVVWKARN